MAMVARFWKLSSMAQSHYSVPFSFNHLRHISCLRNIWIWELTDPNKQLIVFDPREEPKIRKLNSNIKNEFRSNSKNRSELSRVEDQMYCSLIHFVIHTLRCIDYRRTAINSLPWKHFLINTIHSPKIDNVLDAFDGAILMLSSDVKVQSQSIIIDNKQMMRYVLPRIIFINNLYEKGADPWQVLNLARSMFGHRSAAIQVPIGLEDDFHGLVDLVQLKVYYFDDGEKIVVEEVPQQVPADMEAFVLEKRHELIETVSQVDNKLAEAFRSDKPISASDLQEAIRRATIACKFIPVFMGDALDYNEGLRLLLDGVINYLPCPIEASNYALDQSKNGEKPTLVASAFIFSERWKFGHLTYLRIYEGVIRTGDLITNVKTGKTFKVPRLFQTKNDWLKAISVAYAGQIVVVFDLYKPDDNFTLGLTSYTMASGDASEPEPKDYLDEMKPPNVVYDGNRELLLICLEQED